MPRAKASAPRNTAPTKYPPDKFHRRKIWWTCAYCQVGAQTMAYYREGLRDEPFAALPEGWIVAFDWAVDDNEDRPAWYVMPAAETAGPSWFCGPSCARWHARDRWIEQEQNKNERQHVQRCFERLGATKAGRRWLEIRNALAGTQDMTTDQRDELEHLEDLLRIHYDWFEQFELTRPHDVRNQRRA